MSPPLLATLAQARGSLCASWYSAERKARRSSPALPVQRRLPLSAISVRKCALHQKRPYSRRHAGECRNRPPPHQGHPPPSQRRPSHAPDCLSAMEASLWAGSGPSCKLALHLKTSLNTPLRKGRSRDVMEWFSQNGWREDVQFAVGAINKFDRCGSCG